MNNENIRKAIKWYMIDNGVNGVDLAAQMGISASHLSGMLTGKKPLTKKIINYFGVSQKANYELKDSTLKKYIEVLQEG